MDRRQGDGGVSLLTHKIVENLISNWIVLLIFSERVKEIGCGAESARGLGRAASTLGRLAQHIASPSDFMKE